MTLFWIGIIILGVGLIQSVLSLFKDFSKEHKRRYKIAQIVVFIVLFIFGIVSLFITNKKSNDATILQTNIFSKVSDQMKYLESLVKSNDTLIKTSDSINNHLLSQNKLARSLISQYEHVNSHLSKQIDLDLKKFTNEAPNLTILDSDNSWIKSDTKSYTLSVCIVNIGKRAASIKEVLGYALFYRKEHSLFTNCVIHNTTKQYLPTFELRNTIRFLSDQSKDLILL